MAKKSSNRDLIIMLVMTAVIAVQFMTIREYQKITDRMMDMIRRASVAMEEMESTIIDYASKEVMEKTRQDAEEACLKSRETTI